MKATLSSLILCFAAAMPFAVPSAFGQVSLPALPHHWRRLYTVQPLKDPNKLPDIIHQASAGTTIPLWSYSIVSPVDGKTYAGQMVGRSPFYHGHRSTSIPTYVVPVALTFSDTGDVFDASQSDSCIGDSVLNVVMNSPIFQNASFTMNGANVGTTQYIDAFQRASFWTDVSGTPYHTVLSPTVLPVINITVPVADGQTQSAFCGVYATMDYDWWDNMVQNTILPSLAAQGVSPLNLPMFIFDSVVMYANGDPNQCCILGYHGAYTPPSGVLQTYSITNFDTGGIFGGDIATTSHEVGEWMNDPVGTDPTPSWGHIGQVSGCQGNLEVGDPLSGTFFPSVTMNNFTYNPQELAFYSWFYRQVPSLGSGGFYSNNGTFNSGAGAVCQ